MDRDKILGGIEAYLAKEFSMDSESIAEMSALFLESLAAAAEKAGKALESGDFAELAAAGHAIKGSAANIGADSVSAIGAALDDAAKAGDAAVCAEKVAELAAASSALNAAS